MHYVICLAIFNASEILQANRRKNIHEIVRCLKELVKVCIVLQGQKLRGEFR